MSIKIALDFLRKLEKNNNREWFADNKSEYERAIKEVKSLTTDIYKHLQLHDDLEKMKLFRIYRDVRFSKNKQPYKNNFGVAYHRTKPRLRGGYYLQIEPDNNFMATGFWNPEKEDLLRIRKEFEVDDSDIREIINENTLKSVWGDLAGEELKTAPKGFDKTHDAIDLIRRKQFIFVKKLSNRDVMAPDFAETVSNNFKAIRPFFNYMSAVLTTDLNGVSIIKD